MAILSTAFTRTRRECFYHRVQQRIVSSVLFLRPRGYSGDNTSRMKASQFITGKLSARYTVEDWTFWWKTGLLPDNSDSAYYVARAGNYDVRGQIRCKT